MNEDKSSRFHRLKRRAAIGSVLLSSAFYGGLLFSGASTAMADLAASMAGATRQAAPTVAVYVLLLFLLNEIVAFPIAFYSGFMLERRYGLSHEHPGAWLRDRAKSSALALALGLAGAQAVYFAMRLWPRGWWMAAAAVFAAAGLVITWVTPMLVLPLFYRFRPLERESLRGRLLALSARAGVPVLDVYEWGLGASTTRANAALVGAGATRRVLVSDTLLQHYSDDEAEVILAHEIGHHVHRDIPHGLALESLLLLAGLAVAALALDRWWRPLGLASPNDVAGLPLLMLACGGTLLACTPLVNAVSRANERRADRFALRLTGSVDAYVSALRRLGVQNLAEMRPSRLALWLFHTHPPIEERIAAARECGGRGGVPAEPAAD